MIPLFMILIIRFISAVYGDVIDVEHTQEYFNPVGINLRTDPDDQLVFDVVPPIPPSDQGLFIFRFRVMSGGETHVALSDQYKGRSLMYEIVFGTNRNRYTAVKRCLNRNCEEMAAVLMPDAVSLDQIQDLWVGYNFAKGMIAVGRGADSLPDLEARISDPFSVSDLGFSTQHGTIGYWWFPQEHIVTRGCGSLLFKTSKSYSYQYTLPVIPLSSATELELKFAVMGKADVRILLAPEVGLTDQKPAYEIIIGASSNTKSEIRRCNNAIECCGLIASAETPDILIKTAFVKFHVIYTSGLLKVFSEDDDAPFLSVRDPYPLSVRAIGYSQGPYNGGMFEFPVQGITLGLLVFDTEPDSPFNLDLPLVPESKARDLELSFLVKAQHSVLVAFSPEKDINTYDGPLYEIIIGGWNNERSAIRLCKGCGSKMKQDHLPLDPNEFRAFRMSIRDGNINVYQGHHEEPTLYFQDPNSLAIRSVGFTTSDHASGRFVFDTCNLYGS